MLNKLVKKISEIDYRPDFKDDCEYQVKEVEYRNFSSFRLTERVSCPPKRLRVLFDTCESLFVDANAMKDRRSKCYACKHGKRYREIFAFGGYR